MRVPGFLHSRRAEVSEDSNLNLRSGRLIRGDVLADAIRLRPAVRTSLWIAILALAALLPAIRVADAQVAVVLVSTSGQTPVATQDLAGLDLAQGFTTGDNADGYTLTSIDVDFENAPTGLNVKVLTGLPDNATEIAELVIPATPAAGINTFTAPADTTLSANTTYYVRLRLTSGTLNTTTSSNDDANPANGWSVGDGWYQRDTGTNMWTLATTATAKIAVKGYAIASAPAIEPQPTAPSPDPTNLSRGPIQWQDQGQSDGQGEAQASTQAFPTQLNEISANKPTNASGSLDLSPIPASISEDRRPQSRGFYLTATVNPPGRLTVQDAESTRYTLARGASLIKVRLWHVYHHVGRGLNSVELLGAPTANDRDNRLTEPVEVCLLAPAANSDRARIAVRGQHDRHWTILETTQTNDGRICAPTTRIAWLIIVLEPPQEPAAA